MGDKEFYEEIGKINESLDELVREVKGETKEEVGPTIMTKNEIEMPIVEETNVDVKKPEKSGRGQIILIIALSIALCAVLVSMIYFVNTL